jgi:hypothetical protein
MIYDPISISLPEWEVRWRENGLPERHLNPGRDPDYVTARLVEEFETPPLPSLVHWFAWQDGSVDDWIAAPTGHALLGLSDAILQRRVNLKVNSSQEPAEAFTRLFDERWLPVTFGENWMRVVHVDTGALIAFDWWDPETPLHIDQDLFTALAGWQGVLDMGLYQWNEAEQKWIVDERDLPDKLRRARLIG